MKKAVKVVMSLMFLLVFVAGCKRDITFSGFKIGQEIDVQDEDVRAEYSLGKPLRGSFEEVEYFYDECNVLKVEDNNFTEVAVDVSTDNKIVGIWCKRFFSSHSDAILGLKEMVQTFLEKHKDKVAEIHSPNERECTCKLRGDVSCKWSTFPDFSGVMFACTSKEFNDMEEKEQMIENKVESQIAAAIAKLEKSLEEYYMSELEASEIEKFESIERDLKFAFSKITTKGKGPKKVMNSVEQFLEDEGDDIIQGRRKYNAYNKRDRFYDIKRRLAELIPAIIYQ